MVGKRDKRPSRVYWTIVFTMGNLMTTISVALCTYNGERFLQQQLESLAGQTWLPDELIICDDASTDRSVEIAQSFVAAAPFAVHLIHNKENLGYVKNFERAISHCSKDVIFLCDQDDVWLQSKLAEVIAVFEAESSVGLVLHNFCWIDERNNPYPGPIDTYGPRGLATENLPEELRRNSVQIFMSPYPRAWCGCMMAFRRDFNRVILPIFPGKGHDDWILKVLGPITHVRFLTNELVRYRMHASNTNRRDLDKRTLGYFVGRFLKKLKLVMKGHTKRGFYREVIQRVNNSGYPILYVDLLKSYRRWCTRP